MTRWLAADRATSSPTANGRRRRARRGRVDAGRTPRCERTWGRRPGFLGWLIATDHKEIGLRFIITAFVLLRARRHAGAADALQLAVPENTLLGPDLYNQFFTDARHDDDVPLRRAGHGGDGALPRAADGRHAQRLLPAAA